MLAFEVGQEVKGNIFNVGELVDVTGTSKGKGYQGVIKRWNYHLGPAAHGSGYHRGTGSMGSIQPARIKPGKNYQVVWVVLLKQFKILNLLNMMLKIM